MKKLFVILAAAMLVMSAAATAGANSLTSLNLTFYANANADGNTGVVIPNGIEIGIDLGNADSWADLTDFNTGVTIDSFGSSVNTGWEDVLVAGYAAFTETDFSDFTYPTKNSWYMTGTDGDKPFGNFMSSVGNIVGSEYTASYNEINWNESSNSYIVQLGGGSVNPTGNSMDTNMSSIADGLTLSLYYGSTEGLNFGAPEVTELSLIGTLNLSLNDAGEVIVNAAASPVPVPAAVWLMATGLLGVLGIRRKN